jgi:outer membrane protein assembly factor BamB
VLVGLFWALAFVFRGMELSTFARFLSTIALCLFLTLFFSVWWLANRRVRGRDRLLVFGAAVAGGVLAALLTRDTFGLIGVLLTGLPFVFAVWTAWLLLARGASAPVQRLGLSAAILLTWASFGLLRLDGLSGEQRATIRWRWSPTAEDLYLAERARAAEADGGSVDAAPYTPILRPGDWPGFRGPGRDGAVCGVRIATDWDTAPPREVWRRKVGPGWSSAAVVGDRLFTQEQRGPVEAVVCLDAATGRDLWAHEDAVRFQEGVAGAGPRATPTFADGSVYALGATGILNCLDATTGERQWSRDIAADAGAKVPLWGFSSSPLVVQGVVVVFAGGDGDRNLLAYRTGSGEPAWTAAVGGTSYSSPQLASLGGEELVLFLSDRGLTAVDPASGAVRWEHAAYAPGAPRSLQPQLVGTTQVLIASEADLGTALIDVARDGRAWRTDQRWASKALKPSFNDFVVHNGFVYGFDGTVFSCIDLESGARRWRKGKYDHGQVLLLPDQQLLLVVSEDGQAILLAASPERHKELGRFKAVNGKTWNHPAIAHGRLYVRNGEEMACYELGSGN